LHVIFGVIVGHKHSYKFFMMIFSKLDSSTYLWGS